MKPTNLEDPLADAPAELLAFLDQAASLQSKPLGIAVLGRDACREYSRAVRGTAWGEALGLVALDDANNSMPHCYVLRGPAAGMVLQFNRVDRQSLRYPSLAAFASALRAALAGGTHIEDLAPATIAPSARQAEVVARLLGAMAPRADQEAYADAAAAVELLLPQLNPDNLPVLQALASDTDFYIREYVALFLKRHACPAYEALASRLAEDGHGQVARPAAEAAKAIRRMLGEARRDAIARARAGAVDVQVRRT